MANITKDDPASRTPETQDQKAIKFVKWPFLKQKKTIVQSVMNKPQETAERLGEPLLFLMRNDQYIDIIEGVQPGRMTLEGKDGKEKEILLSPSRFYSLRYNKNYYKCWVAHEDFPSAFPYEPPHTSRELASIIKALMINQAERDARLQMAIGKKWLLILGGIALLLIILWSTGVFDSILGAVATEAVNNATTTVAQDPAAQAAAVNATKAQINAGLGATVT